MSLRISKDCFPDPFECHNCLRKGSSEVKKQSETKKDFKRCSNCHIMTYCDKDCQRQHWLQVHKKHCKFLAGKALVKNSSHNAATCVRCVEGREASPTEIWSDTSPKSVCNIEDVSTAMKEALGFAFHFHGEGKMCNCSMEYAFDLPFPLGEVTGQYIEFGSTGLDHMLAHVLKILCAMVIKTRNEDHKQVLESLWSNIILQRSILWRVILVGSIFPVSRIRHELVNSVKSIYGTSNPWWNTLKFSFSLLLNTWEDLPCITRDSHSIEDLRFQYVKLVHDYEQSQLQNQAMVSKKQIWHKFMLWPQLVNGSLALLVPDGTRCQNCFDELHGEVTIVPDEDNFKSRPNLVGNVGDNGALMACCPVAKNKNCVKICISKNVKLRMQYDGDQWEEFMKEIKLFGVESRECDFCLKSSLSAHRCSACLTVQYCSTDCQKEDLEFHMSVCSSWAKDKSRKLLGRDKQKDHWKSVFGKK